jgi:hypothetical protein
VRRWEFLFDVPLWFLSQNCSSLPMYNFPFFYPSHAHFKTYMHVYYIIPSYVIMQMLHILFIICHTLLLKQTITSIWTITWFLAIAVLFCKFSNVVRVRIKSFFFNLLIKWYQKLFKNSLTFLSYTMRIMRPSS